MVVIADGVRRGDHRKHFTFLRSPCVRVANWSARKGIIKKRAMEDTPMPLAEEALCTPCEEWSPGSFKSVLQRWPLERLREQVVFAGATAAKI